MYSWLPRGGLGHLIQQAEGVFDVAGMLVQPALSFRSILP